MRTIVVRLEGTFDDRPICGVILNWSSLTGTLTGTVPLLTVLAKTVSEHPFGSTVPDCK